LIPDIGRLAANWRDEEIPGLTRPILGVGVVADVWKGVRKDWGVEAVLSRRYYGMFEDGVVGQRGNRHLTAIMVMAHLPRWW